MDWIYDMSLAMIYAMWHEPPSVCMRRADSRFAPSQWETALLCNDVTHWLGACLESALVQCPVARQGHCHNKKTMYCGPFHERLRTIKSKSPWFFTCEFNTWITSFNVWVRNLVQKFNGCLKLNAKYHTHTMKGIILYTTLEFQAFICLRAHTRF